MPARARLMRQIAVGYVAGCFAVLPVAPLCWNAWLRDTIGRYLTVNHIHVVQYLGLGCLAALYGRSVEEARGRRGALALLVAGVGFFEELVQWVLPQRFFEWSDVWLNWIGGALGLLLCPGAGWLVTHRSTRHVARSR